MTLLFTKVCRVLNVRCQLKIYWDKFKYNKSREIYFCSRPVKKQYFIIKGNNEPLMSRTTKYSYLFTQSGLTTVCLFSLHDGWSCRRLSDSPVLIFHQVFCQVRHIWACGVILVIVMKISHRLWNYVFYSDVFDKETYKGTEWFYISVAELKPRVKIRCLKYQKNHRFSLNSHYRLL